MHTEISLLKSFSQYIGKNLVSSAGQSPSPGECLMGWGMPMETER